MKNVGTECLTFFNKKEYVMFATFQGSLGIQLSLFYLSML